jgi:phytanoyl-CoA hydroxylase
MDSQDLEQKKLSYDEEGYVKFDSFYDEAFIDRINEVIDSLNLIPCEIVFDEDGTGKIKQIQYLWLYETEDRVFNNILDDLIILGQKLTGETELSLLNMQLFEKHPHISKPTRSHQDNAYFKIKPATALTFWLSLDEIDEENGCLYYAPKTHLTPTRKHQRYHKDTTFRVRSGVPGLSLCLREHPEETDTPMITKKGDLLVHNCNLVHRAGANSSEDKRRRAIGIVFIPKSCEVDQLLEKYHNDRLKEDIKLQRIKDPEKYKKQKEKFKYLYTD